MNSVIMDIDINQLIKEREDGKLLDIVNALQSAHCIKYMSSQGEFISVELPVRWILFFTTLLLRRDKLAPL